MTTHLFNLQLFAEGAGAASSVGEGSASTPGVESQSPAVTIKGLPDKVREKVYGKSAAPKAPVAEVKEKANVESAPVAKKPTYEELINSDEYREEHRKHVKKAVDDRWKKYNGIEAQLKEANEALEIAAYKYGLDPTSEGFAVKLKEAMEADDIFVQDYAEKHDMPTDEARRVLAMQRKMDRLERAEEAARRDNAAREFTQKVVNNAIKTKARFPEFDLDTAMQDKAFVRLVQATNGNTTAAYMAMYGEDVINRTAQAAEARAAEAVTASVKSNASRPVENGIGGNATAVTQVDVKNMTLDDFRKIRDNFKRTGVRPKF